MCDYASRPRLDERAEPWRSELRDRLTPLVTALDEPGERHPRKRRTDGLSSRIEPAVRPVVTEWASRRATELPELLAGIAPEAAGALVELRALPHAVGAELAGMALPDDQPEPGAWSIEDLPVAAPVAVEWPAPTSRVARGDRLKPLDESIAAFVERMCTALRAAAETWVRTLHDDVERGMRASAERFLRDLATQPDDEDLATVESLAGRFAGFTDAAGSMPLRVPVVVPPRRRVSCPVCRAAERTREEHLVRAQLDLAVNEHDQAEHAARGGFCPLHTWQYEAMANTIGVSAGYAKLAESAATALERMDARPATRPAWQATWPHSSWAVTPARSARR